MGEGSFALLSLQGQGDNKKCLGTSTMEIERNLFNDIIVIVPSRFADHRGFFSESWNRKALESK